MNKKKRIKQLERDIDSIETEVAIVNADIQSIHIYLESQSVFSVDGQWRPIQCSVAKKLPKRTCVPYIPQDYTQKDIDEASNSDTKN